MIVDIPQISKQIIDLTPLLTSAVIAPHGMTDLIHAEENNKVFQLLRINAICVASCVILHCAKLDIATNLIFMTSSALHFRHDYPIKNNFLKILLSSLFVLNSQSIGVEIFILYMCFIHVPNHYNIYKELIQDNFKKSFTYLATAGTISTMLMTKYPQMMYDENVYTVSKALIISHIIYEEIYTKNNTNIEKYTEILN